MNIDSIQNGIVIDHITAGQGMRLYELLGLERLDCSVAIIKNVVSSMTPYHTVEMVDHTGSRISMTVYFGDISYKIVSYSPGYQRVEDVSVSMVEQ